MSLLFESIRDLDINTSILFSLDFVNDTILSFFFSIWVFFSQTFTNYRTAGEGGGRFLNSSLPFPPASQTLRH